MKLELKGKPRFVSYKNTSRGTLTIVTTSLHEWKIRITGGMSVDNTIGT